MTTKPHGAKPQDHKQSIEEERDARLERDELLKGMPKLKPAERLRIRERNRLQAIMVHAVRDGAFGEDEEQKSLDFDLRNPEDVKRYEALVEIAASVDEFAESIAENPDEYATWAEGKELDVFMAILSAYNEAAGE